MSSGSDMLYNGIRVASLFKRNILSVEIAMSMQEGYRCEVVKMNPRNSPASIVVKQNPRLRNFVYVQLVVFGNEWIGTC